MLPAASALSLSIAKRRSLQNFSFHSFFPFCLPTFCCVTTMQNYSNPCIVSFFVWWWWVQMKAALARMPWGLAGREESADSDYTVPPWSRTVCPTRAPGCSYGSGRKPCRLGGKQKLSPLIWPRHCATLSAYEMYLHKHVSPLLQGLRTDWSALKCAQCMKDLTKET